MRETHMVTWQAFEASAPLIAEHGRRLLYGGGEGDAMLATVRADLLPRIHPVNVGVMRGGLYAFLLDSAKRRDLERDGRYAMHALQDPVAPSEFLVRGRALPVTDERLRSSVATEWYFAVDDRYRLFEFSIETALLGSRPTAEAWPPAYVTWTADGGEPRSAGPG